MLNITRRISFSNSTRRYITALRRKQGGSFTTASWDRVQKSVKNEISARLFANQGFKCVYCERYLINMGPEIDHFAHKGHYPQFSFTAINLFYSCSHCNSPAKKGQRPTINLLRDNYNDCTFLIVHPFIHNPDIEIVFTDPDRIYFDRGNCSDLGRDTIDFFGWDTDLNYSILRSKYLVFERLNPLASPEERLLIQGAISYKKKRR